VLFVVVTVSPYGFGGGLLPPQGDGGRRGYRCRHRSGINPVPAPWHDSRSHWPSRPPARPQGLTDLHEGGPLLLLPADRMTHSPACQRLCLQTADDRRNGTTQVTELSLAEVLLEKGRVAEAGELLALDHLRRHLFWKAQLFRYAVAAARYEARSGGHAQRWARRALEIARDPAPQLPRHPNLGLPQPDDATITEMERLATSD
jgi:hypothetical protein